MKTPIDAYREGYEKGTQDKIAGRLAEATMGMLRDDPGGFYSAGYSDGSAGKEFKLPARKQPAELNPFDDKVAVKIVCPNCNALDWFEWKFLGKLTDPVCGHTWYAGSGQYATIQIRAVFSAAGRTIKYMNTGVGKGESAAIAKVVGGFTGATFGIAFRLPFAIIMIPIQAVVRVSNKRAPASK